MLTIKAFTPDNQTEPLTITQHPHNGGWKSVAEMQKARLRAYVGHVRHRAEAIPNGFRVIDRKTETVVQEVTLTE